MKEIRVAILGTGLISHRHMKVWSQIPGVVIVAGCDIDEAKLRAWGERYHITDLYTDYRQMLARDEYRCRRRHCSTTICTPRSPLPL